MRQACARSAAAARPSASWPPGPVTRGAGAGRCPAGERSKTVSLAAQIAILALVLAAVTALAELAANLGTALGIGQIAVTLVLVAPLVKR